MADGIQISTQVLVDTAEKVRSINNALDTKLEEINKSMNDLSSTWKSDAGEEIRAAMNALKPRFEEYKPLLSHMQSFLSIRHRPMSQQRAPSRQTPKRSNKKVKHVGGYFRPHVCEVF